MQSLYVEVFCQGCTNSHHIKASSKGFERLFNENEIKRILKADRTGLTTPENRGEAKDLRMLWMHLGGGDEGPKAYFIDDLLRMIDSSQLKSYTYKKGELWKFIDILRRKGPNDVRDACLAIQGKTSAGLRKKLFGLMNTFFGDDFCKAGDEPHY